MSERWLPIPGWEALYEVSDHGRVRSLDRMVYRPQGNYMQRGRVLSPYRTPPAGYVAINLEHLKRKRRARIHTLVLEAFVGARPKHMECCHNDGDLDNNRLINLRWGTRQDNILDEVRHGTHHQAAKTHCKRGHRFTPQNTYINPTSGSRQCRRCVYEKATGRCSE
jgi:hypothetical protein